MAVNTRMSRKYINLVSEETLNSLSPADVDMLIQRGLLEQEQHGGWYRVYDLRILGNELYGLIKRIFVSPKEIRIQLY